MHQYEAAEVAVAEARRMLPDSPKPYAAEALLFALRGEREEAVSPIAEKLLYTFPFMEVHPYIAIGKDEDGFFFILHDIYAVSLMEAYEKLVKMRGDEVKYKFVVMH